MMSVDMIVGFCTEGPLSSPRVAGIVQPVASLFTRAFEAGVRNFLFFQDTHDEHAPQFESFGSHCVAGSRESEMVPELRGLPFSELFDVRPKNSLSSAIGTGLDDWLVAHRDVDRFIVVGDCTDLCVYQLAMHLRLTANAANLDRMVIVPADCVDTYDMPLNRAADLGVMPHDAELMHRLFLYHLALNGIKVVASLI
jgi:nicotinamidase-related amidase